MLKSQIETEEIDAITPVQKGTERILLVDDEEPIIRMEKQMLERLGYQVTACTSSPDALMAFRASPGKFDLVITDMTMPKMTGVQLSQKFLEIRPDIPIIICTGFSTKVDGEKAKAAGIRGYVMKPVVTSEIAQKNKGSVGSRLKILLPGNYSPLVVAANHRYLQKRCDFRSYPFRTAVAAGHPAKRDFASEFTSPELNWIWGILDFRSIRVQAYLSFFTDQELTEFVINLYNVCLPYFVHLNIRHNRRTRNRFLFRQIVF